MSEITFAERLRAPFPPSDVSWRIGQAGENAKGYWAKVLAYLDNRAIMDRLDEVIGPVNWRNEYGAGPQGGVVCGLSLRIGGEWITKWDGAENTDIEAVKGGLSDAMKRAAVQWGIGRYLYGLGESWAVIRDQGAHYANCKIKKDGQEKWISFRWDHPRLPQWALPNGVSEPAKIAKQLEQQTKPPENGAPTRGDEHPELRGCRDAPEKQDEYIRIKKLFEEAGDENGLHVVGQAIKAALDAKKLSKGLYDLLVARGKQARAQLESLKEQEARF